MGESVFLQDRIVRGGLHLPSSQQDNIPEYPLGHGLKRAGETRRGQDSQLADIQVVRVLGDLHHFFSCLLPVLSAVSAVA